MLSGCNTKGCCPLEPRRDTAPDPARRRTSISAALRLRRVAATRPVASLPPPGPGKKQRCTLLKNTNHLSHFRTGVFVGASQGHHTLEPRLWGREAPKALSPAALSSSLTAASAASGKQLPTREDGWAGIHSLLRCCEPHGADPPDPSQRPAPWPGPAGCRWQHPLRGR